MVKLPFFVKKENEMSVRAAEKNVYASCAEEVALAAQPERPAERPQTSASLKQRKCEGPCSTARQQGRPPQPPSLTSSDPQVRWLASGLGPGQTADEVLRFLGPPSPNLAGQHNQPGPPVATRELTDLAVHALTLVFHNVTFVFRHLDAKHGSKSWFGELVSCRTVLVRGSERTPSRISHAHLLTR